MRRLLLALVLLGKASGLAVGLSGGSLAWALTLFFLPGFVLMFCLLAPSAPGLVRVFTRFETPRREVWLTIDDGPDESDTPRALAALAQHGAKATFFVIGEKAAARPDLVRAIREAGHEVAHHTHTHPAKSFWCAGPRRLARELDAPLAELSQAGVIPTRFRPPVGIKNFFLEPALLARNLVCVGWSLRSWDSVRKDPRSMVDDLMARVSPGTIILLHEGPLLDQAIRERGLVDLLAALTEAGYRCVVPSPGQLRR